MVQGSLDDNCARMLMMASRDALWDLLFKKGIASVSEHCLQAGAPRSLVSLEICRSTVAWGTPLICE